MQCVHIILLVLFLKSQTVLQCQWSKSLFEGGQVLKSSEKNVKQSGCAVGDLGPAGPDTLHLEHLDDPRPGPHRYWLQRWPPVCLGYHEHRRLAGQKLFPRFLNSISWTVFLDENSKQHGKLSV